MEKEALLRNARWDMVQQVAEGPLTAAEIARGAETSLPNVSQQLRLLEAYDIVSAAGKPRKRYSLKRGVCHLTLAEDGFAHKKFFQPSRHQQFLLRTFFLPEEEQLFLLKGLLERDEILERCSVALVKNATDSIELLFVTEDVEDIRGKYSNFSVEYDGKKKQVVAWTHNPLEINEGLERKDKHFEHLMRSPRILHDPNGRFKEVHQ